MKFENENVVVTIEDGHLSVQEPGRVGYEFGHLISENPNFQETILTIGEAMIRLVKDGNRVNKELEQLKDSIQLLHNQT